MGQILLMSRPLGAFFCWRKNKNNYNFYALRAFTILERMREEAKILIAPNTK
jgi:hypothetical protein